MKWPVRGQAAGMKTSRAHTVLHVPSNYWKFPQEPGPKSLHSSIPAVPCQKSQIQRNEEACLFAGQAGLDGFVSKSLEECDSQIAHSWCHSFPHILSSQGSDGHRDDLEHDAPAGLIHQSNWTATLTPTCRAVTRTIVTLTMWFSQAHPQTGENNGVRMFSMF